MCTSHIGQVLAQVIDLVVCCWRHTAAGVVAWLGAVVTHVARLPQAGHCLRLICPAGVQHCGQGTGILKADVLQLAWQVLPLVQHTEVGTCRLAVPGGHLHQGG